MGLGRCEWFRVDARSRHAHLHSTYSCAGRREEIDQVSAHERDGEGVRDVEGVRDCEGVRANMT